MVDETLITSLFPRDLKIIFPLGGIRGYGINFNEIFTKTPKILIYIQTFIKNRGIIIMLL